MILDMMMELNHLETKRRTSAKVFAPLAQSEAHQANVDGMSIEDILQKPDQR
jgi:hypothetical protein